MSPGKKFVRRASNLVDSGRSQSAVARDLPKLANERNCLLGATFRMTFVHHNKCGVSSRGCTYWSDRDFPALRSHSFENILKTYRISTYLSSRGLCWNCKNMDQNEVLYLGSRGCLATCGLPVIMRADRVVSLRENKFPPAPRWSQ